MFAIVCSLMTTKLYNRFQFEKNTPFPIFCNFCILKCRNEYKAKVSSRTGPLISPVRQGPCGLNPALPPALLSCFPSDTCDVV